MGDDYLRHYMILYIGKEIAAKISSDEIIELFETRIFLSTHQTYIYILIFIWGFYIIFCDLIYYDVYSL